MKNHYRDNRPSFLVNDIPTKDFIKQETLMSQNIYSCFQLAKVVVAKAEETEVERKVILVADDEPLTFKLIAEFFQDANLPYHILSAPNGNMAYALALTKKPDLIITDWLMPELNGLDLIKHLKADSQTRDIPVIMITGAIFEKDEYNMILAAGAVDCIRKPFVDMELIARVKTALALHDALREIEEHEESIKRFQSELTSCHQELASQVELLIHSKNVQFNFIESLEKLKPHLTNEGRAKFFSMLRQIQRELNGEMELCIEKDFDRFHSGLYNFLEKNCPTITKNEKRLCAYLKMNHGASEIAKLTSKSLNSINVAFARLRAKLQLPSSKDLRSFLMEMASESESVTI